MKSIGLSRIIICFLLLSGSLICGGCASKQEKNMTIEPISNCAITGYKQYTGKNKEMFLSEGDTIAVISPSALPSQEQVDAVMNGLKDWGYNPVEGRHVCEEVRTLQDCLEDLRWALEDPDVKAVFCVRGGYAASEVMDILPLEQIAQSGKLIIGYSDISVYHAAWTVSGLPSIHASMSAAFTDLPEDCAEAEQKLLKGEIPSYRCDSSKYCREGTAEGILIGGNLSTFTAVFGTPYDSTIDQPYIIFLEDVEEDYQHIHRYLTVLKHMGVFERAEGIIFGEWTDVPSNPGDYSGSSRGGQFESVADMICREILDDRDIPVAFGFPAGHSEQNYPMLFGETVRLNVSSESYTLEWTE